MDEMESARGGRVMDNGRTTMPKLVYVAHPLHNGDRIVKDNRNESADAISCS